MTRTDIYHAIESDSIDILSVVVPRHVGAAAWMCFRPIVNFDDFARLLLAAILFAMVPVGTSAHASTRIETSKGYFLRLASRIDENPARDPFIRPIRTRIQQSRFERSTVQQL